MQDIAALLFLILISFVVVRGTRLLCPIAERFSKWLFATLVKRFGEVRAAGFGGIFLGCLGMLFFYAPAFPAPLSINENISALPSIASQLDGLFGFFRIFFFGAALFLILGLVAAIVGGEIEEVKE